MPAKSSAFNQLFRKFAVVAGMTVVFGLPAIYWAGSNLFGLDLKKSVSGWFTRVFSRVDGAAEAGGGDDGGD